MIEAEQLSLHFEFRANQTFADFFPGPNQELINHLQQSVAGVGEPFIYLWGQAGQGKSHLLQACCHEAHRRNLSTFYFNLSHQDSIDPSLLKGLDEFELVCLDNIELIAGQAEWEIALFNFFNQQQSHNHKLIVSSEVSPGALAIQLPDLKTRLNWGLSIKIQPLDDNNRLYALRFKARQIGLELSPQAARFLLTRVNRDLASLWKVLEQLDRASLSAQRKLTIPFLKHVLNKHLV